ncbi:enoyl-CoA hydratase/isomerase family protein [Duganella sp. LjRoot269]|jgi:2-(1,2-epoxy-1,2-dihydrophenyl)acetyl-CoA isomerase|uniref:enoyl-CoA hydratase/isomerase family protein n=1 Tax=Duganella sp. LjRoot269 TaxID=3342305 RepID=UPI003ECC1B83
MTNLPDTSSPAAAPVLLERAGAVATIRFNRPAALNAIDRATAEALLAACREIENDASVRVIVLRGEGKAFMAGGDIARFHADLPNAAQLAADIITPLHAALTLLAALPQPVLASVHGAVAGAGVSIALACDLCITADDAQFNLAYARIGASPDGSASWSLPRTIGLRKAMELMLLCDSVDAGEALRLGLVNRVVARAGLDEATAALAQRLAAGPTFAYGQTKRLLRGAFGNDLARQLDLEQAAFCACAGSDDFAEGVNAFFGKRKAAFSGA